MNQPQQARSAAETAAWTRLYREDALEPELPIIDPHHHVWMDARGRYLFEELAEDTGSGHNIVATVFIQSGVNMYRADGPQEMKPVGEVEFVGGIAAMAASGLCKTRLCAGIVGYADMTLGERAAPVLDALLAAGNGRLRGVRHNMAWDPSNTHYHIPQVRHLPLDPALRKGLAQLPARGLSFDAWLFHPQLPELFDLARACPEVSMVINHVGGVLGTGEHAGRRAEIFTAWSGHIRELARLPNLTIKLGGLGMTRCGWDFHLRETPPSSEELIAAWRPYFETCIEAFGPQRCMFESNFPVDKGTSGYGVIWNAFKRMTRDYSAADKAALYHDTAARVYRLTGLPAAAAA